MQPRESDNKLPIVLAGAGFWGSSWAPLIMSSKFATLVGVVDPDGGRLARAGRELQLAEACRFSSFEDAVRHGGARAALIAVPPDAHHEVSLRAIDAGLHCLIEKPFASSLADAREIVDHALSNDRHVMVAQNYRFRRGPETVRRLIGQGALGRLESIHGRMVKQLRLDLEGWRGRMAEPIIIDQAVHHFDFIRGIFGIEPTLVRAHSFNPSWSWFDGNACAAVEFRSEDCYISYFGSWVSRGGIEVDTSFEGSWEIQGQRGCIRWEHNCITLTPSDLGDLIFFPGALERKGGVLEIPLVAVEDEERAGVLREFVEAISADRESQSSGRDNLKTLALVLAAEAAARADEWVNISDWSSHST